MHNWRRYPSSNWYEIDQKRVSKFGALLWRHLTPERKTAIQVYNYSPSCIQLLKKIWENLLPVWLLVRTNLFFPSRFWTTYTNFDTCCHGRRNRGVWGQWPPPPLLGPGGYRGYRGTVQWQWSLLLQQTVFIQYCTSDWNHWISTPLTSRHMPS